MEPTREFIYLPEFEKRLKVAGLSKQDEIAIEKILLANPKIGDVVQGTNGLRKVRYASRKSHSGKSGAFRIFYADIEDGGIILLITLLQKNEKDNLTQNERNGLKQQITKLREFYR